MAVRIDPRKRFWPKVEKTGTCWLWRATVANHYGQFSFGGKLKRAHRVAYELERGPIPEGMQLDHLCGNRLCVNPAHLEVVTPAENLRRRRFRVKTHCPQGHEYTPENTGRHSAGHRFCRACKRDSDARYYITVERDRRRRKRSSPVSVRSTG